MTSLMVGAIAGTLISMAFYLMLGRRDHLAAHRLGTYFFDNWSLDSRMVGATIFSSSMSLATVVIALLQLGVTFGIALMWATICFCVGWLALWHSAPLIQRHVGQMDTIHTFLGRAYGSDFLGMVTSGATILGLIGLFATELFAADIVLSALGAPDSWHVPTILVFGLATIAYTSLGGFRSAVRSDWSQTALLLVALAIIGYLAVRFWMQTGSPTPRLLGTIDSLLLPVSLAISIFFINVPFPFVDMQAWQRLIASKSLVDFRRGTLGAIAAFAATWTVLIFLSTLVAPGLSPRQEPLSALISAAATHSAVPAFVIGLVLIPGLFAAMFSSADGFLNSASATFSLDLAKISRLAPDADVSRRAPYHVMWLGFSALFIALILRLVGFSVVDLVFAVSAGQLALLPAVLAALFRPQASVQAHLKHWAIWSVMSGFAAAWINGFYSVSPTSSNFPPWKLFEEIIPRDAFRSPIYAVVVSGGIFLLGFVTHRLSRSTSPEEER